MRVGCQRDGSARDRNGDQRGRLRTVPTSTGKAEVGTASPSCGYECRYAVREQRRWSGFAGSHSCGGVRPAHDRAGGVSHRARGLQPARSLLLSSEHPPPGGAEPERFGRSARIVPRSTWSKCSWRRVPAPPTRLGPRLPTPGRGSSQGRGMSGRPAVAGARPGSRCADRRPAPSSAIAESDPRPHGIGKCMGLHPGVTMSRNSGAAIAIGSLAGQALGCRTNRNSYGCRSMHQVRGPPSGMFTSAVTWKPRCS